MYRKKTAKNRRPAKKAGKQLATKAYVKEIVQSDTETKQCLYGAAVTWDTTGSALAKLSGMGQGLINGNRVGNEITVRDLAIRYELHIGSSAFLASDEYNVCRLIIFRWYANDTSVPTISDILSQNLTEYVYSFINQDSLVAKKMHIMYDKTHLIEAMGVWDGSLIMADGPGSTLTNQKYIKNSKMGRKHIVYNGTAQTGTGHIYALFLSDSSTVPHPNGWFSSQLNYTDS